MTYVSASHGYRSGGFNVAVSDPHHISYDEEKLWSYEIGVKSAFLDNRLIINGSVYYMEIDDMQVDEAVSPIELYTTNAAEATGKGVELEITARPCDGLSLMAGFGYTDIEFDDFKDALGDYEEVNAKIGYEAKHFDIYLYGKNLFDEEYDSDEYYGGMYTIYSDPGEIGLQLVCRF
jgi:iron complex outermembrane receptor protein